MIATLVVFGAGDDAAAAGGDAGLGLGGRQRAAVRRAAAGRAAGRAGSAASSLDTTSAHVRTIVAQLRAGVRQPRRRAGQRLHRSAARQPAADRRGHRPAERVDALHAAGEPVRHVGVGGGTAGDVAVIAGADAASIEAVRRAARRRPAADRVLRRPVGGGVSRARRRGRGGAAPDRPVQPRRRRLRLGDSRRLGGRPAGVDARPALLVDVLRAARHADAAALRGRARRADDGARLSVRDSAAAAARHRRRCGARPG